jgi:high-affinity iron transporter
VGAAALFAAAGPATALAAQAAQDTWADVVVEMEDVLDEAWARYQDGDVAGAKEQVDVAYYGYYEKLGFEKVVMAHISGSSASAAEYEFGLIKKAMNEGQSEEASGHIDALKVILEEQAVELDGTGENAAQTLTESLIVILREGFEAIIVLGAIIAYLIKSGNQDRLRPVYAGALLALAASVALAFAVNAITALAGANQEITEGVTVLIAAVMLIWVSNWILSKSEGQAWGRYIQEKTQASLSRRSVFSLAFVAFLAVFREGAETILLYQALRARVENTANMLWLGLGLGCVLLVGVYLAIRYLSIRIPIRPFFLATSAVLAVLAFSFAGSGVKELQEGGVVSITPVPWVPSVDLLGVYPSLETLAAQALALVAMAALAVFATRRAARPVPDAVPASPSPNPASSGEAAGPPVGAATATDPEETAPASRPGGGDPRGKVTGPHVDAAPAAAPEETALGSRPGGGDSPSIRDESQTQNPERMETKV